MKLRTRLFVWVGSLFLLAFALSFVLEDYITRSSLIKAENKIRDEIIHLNEVHRLNIEKYLGLRLAEIEAHLDSLLEKIAEYPMIRDGFAPTTVNLEHNTWQHASSLMLSNKWLDFVQNVNNDKLSSLIISNPSLQTEVKLDKQSDELAFATVTEGEEKMSGPFIAVRYHLDQFILSRPVETVVGHKLEEGLTEFWVLFKPETIMQVDVSKRDDKDRASFHVPFMSFSPSPFREEVVKQLYKAVEAGKKLVADHPDILEKSKADRWNKRIALRSKRSTGKPPHAKLPEPRPIDTRLYSSLLDKRVYKRFLEISSRIDELGLTWGLTTLYSLGPFGNTPFGHLSPAGIGLTAPYENSGSSVLDGEVFHDHIQYDYFDCPQSFPEDQKLCLGLKMSTISIPKLDRFFFGNTLRLYDYTQPQAGRTGYLTLAIDGSYFLQNLALSSHRRALFVSGGKIIMAFNPQGDQVKEALWLDIPMKEIEGKNSGTIKVGGREYYFLHMQPFKEADFHFYTFALKSKEFALLNTVTRDAEELISHVGMNMRLAALGAGILVLILLSNIAKRIVKPITHLANATTAVSEGHLDDIHLPALPKKRRDEIYQLYHSFNGMVDGLREKERVRGVLNKVVSSDIAEEILKGNVHLGGEEKVVTVLFADIRCFSTMTEKMQPTDVVTMLNTCMTKISRHVDDFGGVIDKFVGDEVMALFGAPVEKGDSPYQAVQSAIAMMESLREWNQERASQNLPPIEMGIGVHTGPMLAGNMGAENRLNYTVLGANVNLTSRLCSAAGKGEIIISKATFEASEEIKKHIKVEDHASVEAKGFTEPIPVYKVLGYV